MRALTLIGLLLIVRAGTAQDKQAHPGYPPTLLLASASQKNGKVVIQIAQPGVALPAIDGNKKPAGERMELEWRNLKKVTLGETVQAFGVDGRPAAPKDVLNALARPTGVAVFIRSYANDPLTPAPFYRALLRESTIILVVRVEDLYNPKP